MQKINLRKTEKKLDSINLKTNFYNKGITLIALVVTIIILLILVGVTISQISGENGLIRKAKEAVEKYKNASEEEQIQLGKIDQYVSDFEIIGGNEGEGKASVSVKENGLEVTGNVEDKTITVKVTVIGESTGVEYKISSEDNWTKKDTNGTKKETENETEYTHTFEGLELGNSYYIRVKVYDTNNKYVEALSNVITLNNIMTAEDGDVLEGKTYIGKNGTKSTGTMTDYSGKTVEATEVSNDGDFALLTIPKNGYYNTESKLKAKTSNSSISYISLSGGIYGKNAANVSSKKERFVAGKYKAFYFVTCFTTWDGCPNVQIYVDGVLKLNTKRE